MALLEVGIQGTLSLTIFENGVEITDKNKLAEIKKDLDNGGLYMGLGSREILNSDLTEVVYTFDLSVQEDVEYEFDPFDEL